MSGFKITEGRGFRFQFENGFIVSVQWGTTSYSDNNNSWCSPLSLQQQEEEERKAGAKGSATAEVAIIKNGKLLSVEKLMGYDSILPYASPLSVLKVLNWAASQPSCIEKED